MVCSKYYQHNLTVQLESENITETTGDQISSDLFANGMHNMPMKVLPLNYSREVSINNRFYRYLFRNPLYCEHNGQIKGFYNDKRSSYPFDDILFSRKSRNKRRSLKDKLKYWSFVNFELINSLFAKFHFLKIESQNVHLFMLPTSELSRPLSVSAALWETYRKEIVRIHTFSRYPISSSKSALLLASDGFVYIGNGDAGEDAVACFSCRKQKKNWLIGDDIHEVHRRLDPGCPMVTGVNCNNEPLMCSMAALYNASRENESGGSERGWTDPASVQVDGADELQAGVFNDGRENEMESTTQNNPTLLFTLGSQFDLDHLVQLSIDPAAFSSVDTGYRSGTSDITSSGSADLEELVITTSLSRSQATSPSVAIEHVGTPSALAHSNVTPPRGNSLLIPGGTGNTSIQELGIITERPKRPEYALKSKRLETYTSAWPKDHHLKPVDLTEAGFYYAGYGDCARCFYCGGGLRNWEEDDHEWVEHARWFPKCAYARQQHGQVFVDVVQELHRTNDKISYQMVIAAMGASFSTMESDNQDLLLKRDPAVRSLIELGYCERDVLDVAIAVKHEINFICAESLLEKLISEGKQKRSNKPITINSVGDLGETTRRLKEKNNQLRQQIVCKICLDKEVAVVFLPCGHLVSCAECASVMVNCPYCRVHVKGVVRAFMP